MMAFMRGKWYVWSDGISTWFNQMIIPNKVLDEYVVMRYARMDKRTIKRAEKRALKKHHGNIGADGIAKKYGMKTCMEIVETMCKKDKKINDTNISCIRSDK